MTPTAPWHRCIARGGVRARTSWCAGTSPRCRTVPCGPSTSRSRCAGCAKRWTTSSPTCSDLGERVLQRAGPEESRIFDAQILMAQDQDFLASVETLIRKNQLSAETAYEFKALELRNALVGRRPAARAAGRPARDPAPDARPADGRRGLRALVGSRRRAGDRGGPRAVARAHRAARPRARRRAHQRGGHPHGARRDPGPLARHPRGHGRGRRDAAIPRGDDAAARRPERHDRARPEPRRAGGGQGAGEPAPPAGAAARGRGRASRR